MQPPTITRNITYNNTTTKKASHNLIYPTTFTTTNTHTNTTIPGQPVTCIQPASQPASVLSALLPLPPPLPSTLPAARPPIFASHISQKDVTPGSWGPARPAWWLSRVICKCSWVVMLAFVRASQPEMSPALHPEALGCMRRHQMKEKEEKRSEGWRQEWLLN